MICFFIQSVQSQSCLTLWDPIDCSMPGLPVHHKLPEFIQIHVNWVGDNINFFKSSLVAQLVKNSPAGDLGSIPGLGRCHGEGNGYQLHYSGLENSMGCIVHGVTESDTTERLSLSISLSYSSIFIIMSNYNFIKIFNF